jgi:hypothetical protein
VPAKHDGFTDDELDFIPSRTSDRLLLRASSSAGLRTGINYDIEDRTGGCGKADT